MLLWLFACNSLAPAMHSEGQSRHPRESKHERRDRPERPAPSDLSPEANDTTPLTEVEAGVDTLPPEVESALARRGARPSTADRPPTPSGASVPFFVRPFRGVHPAVNWFNHGGSKEERLPMAFTGELIQGKLHHVAYDYMTPSGTPLFSVADGIVVVARDGGKASCPGGANSDHSIMVKIFHPDAPNGEDYMSAYAHMDRMDVKPGQTVKAGQQIGLSGATGCAKGPHLHFEVTRITDPSRMSGRAIDPYGWTGRGPDPMAHRGNVNLWKPGEAPPLYRGNRGPIDDAIVAVMYLRALDALAPVDGEFVQIGHRRQGAPTSLKGWEVRNLAGDRFPLPDLVLRPGETLRLWSGSVQTPRGGRDEELATHEVALKRSAPLWNDTGDCARLFDASGRLVSALPYGQIEKTEGACTSQKFDDVE